MATASVLNSAGQVVRPTGRSTLTVSVPSAAIAKSVASLKVPTTLFAAPTLTAAQSATIQTGLALIPKDIAARAKALRPTLDKLTATDLATLTLADMVRKTGFSAAQVILMGQLGGVSVAISGASTGAALVGSAPGGAGVRVSDGGYVAVYLLAQGGRPTAEIAALMRAASAPAGFLSYFHGDEWVSDDQPGPPPAPTARNFAIWPQVSREDLKASHTYTLHESSGGTKSLTAKEALAYFVLVESGGTGDQRDPLEVIPQIAFAIATSIVGGAALAPLAAAGGTAVGAGDAAIETFAQGALQAVGNTVVSQGTGAITTAAAGGNPDPTKMGVGAAIGLASAGIGAAVGAVAGAVAGELGADASDVATASAAASKATGALASKGLATAAAPLVTAPPPPARAPRPVAVTVAPSVPEALPTPTASAPDPSTATPIYATSPGPTAEALGLSVGAPAPAEGGLLAELEGWLSGLLAKLQALISEA